MAAEHVTSLRLVFDVHVKKKLGVLRPQVPDLVLVRTERAKVRDITDHLELHLILPNGSGYSMLLQAVCTEGYTLVNRGFGPTCRGPVIIPLVSDHLWTRVLTSYPYNRLKVLVEKRPTLQRYIPNCWEFLQQRELKCIDVDTYFPKKLERKNIYHLCENIFRNGIKIKDKLRRGIWPHLVGVYHPSLKTHEEREMYFEKLRRVYDSLKGKWQGVRGAPGSQYQRLSDNVKRDAMRTDPNESFYTAREDGGRAEEDNIQKLVDVLVIYILEHNGVSYTQGMTDLLSPILYVMQSEADAYICFSAMLEQLQENFSIWCYGTLNKVERLRHLCEVLDPQLHSYLTHSIQEDAFALFFGMVLISCRREFSFSDSFHLLEVVWSARISMQPPPEREASRPPSQPQPQSQWARYMTYESEDLVQQVFGEAQSPYSAEPLGRTVSQYSENPSLASQMSVSSMRRDSVPLHIDTHTAEPVEPVYSHESRNDSPPLDVECSGPHEKRERSNTDPSNNQTSPPQLQNPNHLSTSPGKQNCSFSHSESELYDNFSNTIPPESKVRNPKELSEMSSVSSGNGSANLQRSTEEGRSRIRTKASFSTDGSSHPSSASLKLELSTDSSHRNSKIFRRPNGLETSLENGPILNSGHFIANGGVAEGFSETGLDRSVEPTPIQSPAHPTSVLTNGCLATGHLPLSHHANLDSHTQQIISDSEDEDNAAVLSVHDDVFTSSRITPVPFFDAMEQLATSSTSPHHARSQAHSEMIISQLVSAEQLAPAVTREGSLQVPFVDSFPLFICLAILVQSRNQIMQRGLDFVGLSVLLNTQAGAQDLTATLRVAKRLHSIYRHYQCMCSCTRDGLNIWLDDAPVVRVLQQGTDIESNHESQTGRVSELSINNSSVYSGPA